MKRRQILIGVAGAALASVAPLGALGRSAWAEETPVHPDDRTLGAADAPITMIEYSSLTCPHCAAFHQGALPKIKETWIAQGKLRLIYRHFPLDGLGLRAAAVSNCVEGDRHFAFLDLLFKNQQKWARAQDPLKVLGQYARLAGLSGERFEACVNDRAEMDKILARAQEGRASYNVQSTPTLIVNGEKVEGAQPLEKFESIFRKTVPGA